MMTGLWMTQWQGPNGKQEQLVFLPIYSSHDHLPLQHTHSDLLHLHVYKFCSFVPIRLIRGRQLNSNHLRCSLLGLGNRYVILVGCTHISAMYIHACLGPCSQYLALEENVLNVHEPSLNSEWKRQTIKMVRWVRSQRITPLTLQSGEYYASSSTIERGNHCALLYFFLWQLAWSVLPKWLYTIKTVVLIYYIVFLRHYIIMTFFKNQSRLLGN